jgi:hypothetical protein
MTSPIVATRQGTDGAGIVRLRTASPKAKQNDSARGREPHPHGELSEVLVESYDETCFALGTREDVMVGRADHLLLHPDDVVSTMPKPHYNGAGNILVC